MVMRLRKLLPEVTGHWRLFSSCKLEGRVHFAEISRTDCLSTEVKFLTGKAEIVFAFARYKSVADPEFHVFYGIVCSAFGAVRRSARSRVHTKVTKVREGRQGFERFREIGVTSIFETTRGCAPVRPASIFDRRIGWHCREDADTPIRRHAGTFLYAGVSAADESAAMTTPASTTVQRATRRLNV